MTDWQPTTIQGPILITGRLFCKLDRGMEMLNRFDIGYPRRRQVGVSNRNLRIMSSLLLAVFLLMVTARSFDVVATQDTIGEVLPSLASTPKPCSASTTGRCSPVLFSDEFDGPELYPDKWDVIRGTPVVSGGWLMLSDADIQSKPEFHSGILQGVIQSSDWKPHNQFTDSSFGFEIWTGNNGQCHYGILFKPSGHLAILRSQPDTNGNCFGDPIYQAYPEISNWDAVLAGSTVSFTLSWCSDSVVLGVSGNRQEGQASYTGQAVPTVPLKTRLYVQSPETYKIAYVLLCACYGVHLPIIVRQ